MMTVAILTKPVLVLNFRGRRQSAEKPDEICDTNKNKWNTTVFPLYTSHDLFTLSDQIYNKFIFNIIGKIIEKIKKCFCGFYGKLLE